MCILQASDSDAIIQHPANENDVAIFAFTSKPERFSKNTVSIPDTVACESYVVLLHAGVNFTRVFLKSSDKFFCSFDFVQVVQTGQTNSLWIQRGAEVL
jgi:hypothetical protein